MQTNKKINIPKIGIYKDLDVKDLKNFENKNSRGVYKQIVEINYKPNYKCDVSYVYNRDIGLAYCISNIMIKMMFLGVLLFIVFNLFKFILR